MSKRLTIVTRLAMVLLYVNRTRVPDVKSIARGLGVHPRTVARDIEAIEAAGWPMPSMRVDALRWW